MSDLVIKLTIDASQLNATLGQVTGELKRLGAHKVDIDTSPAASKIAGLRNAWYQWTIALGGAVMAIRAVGSAVSGLIEPALEAEAGLTKVQAAVESTKQAAGYTAEQLASMATEMEEAFAIDGDKIMNEITTPLLTFTKISGEAFEESQVAVANMARALDGDFKSAALQVGKALNDPVQGLAALRKSGVSFTDQQIQVIKTLWQTGDAAQAQKLILEELNKEFGGQAAAFADSYAGQIAKLQIAFENLKESLGGALLPAISSVLPAIQQMIKDIGPALTSLMESLGGLTASLLPQLIPFLDTIFNAVKELLPPILDIVNALLPLLPAVNDIVKAITSGLVPVIKAILNALTPLIEAVVSFAAELGERLAPIIEQVMIAIQPLANMMGILFQAISPVLDVVLNLSLKLTDALLPSILAVTEALAFITKPLNAIVEAIFGASTNAGALSSELELVNESTKRLEQAADGAKLSAESEAAQFDQLATRLKELRTQTELSNSEKSEMSRIVNDMNGKYGKFIGNIDLEKSAWDDVSIALSNAKNNLIAYYTAKSLDDEIEAVAKAIGNVNREMAKLKPSEQQWTSFYDALQSDNPNAMGIIAQSTAGASEKMRELQRELFALQAQYQGLKGIATATQESLNNSTGGQGSIPGSGESTSSGGSSGSQESQALLDYQQLANTLRDYQRSELDRIAKEYKENEALITQYTTKESAERKELMGALDKWRIDEEKKVSDLTLQNEAAYYESVKFIDAGYYDWKINKINEEAQLLGLKGRQQTTYIAAQVAALDKERTAWERLPLDEVIDKYSKLQSKMSDSGTIGSAAWEAIKKGLIAVKEELQQYKDLPDVADILAKLQGDIDKAQENSEGKKGNFFWNGIMGFNPDSPADIAKIDQIKGVFADLQNSVSTVLNGLVQQNQQRREDELASIEESAEREKWADEDLQNARSEVNKKYLAEEKRLKNIQKAMSISQAVINTAEAVVKAYTLGPILGPIAALTIGALGAVQIKLIAAQKFARGGLFQGQGGPTDDQNLVALSNGEFVVNAKATERYFPLLRQINADGAGEKTGLSEFDKNYLYTIGNDLSPILTPGWGTWPRKANFASGGLVDGVSVGGLERLIERIDILNMNLVKKELVVEVFNTPQTESIIRKQDKTRRGMVTRGYDEDLQR
jgi:hypothetical protein